MAVAVNWIPEKPEVQSLSGKELDCLLALLLAEKAGYTLPDDVSTIIEDTACLTCLSESQLEQSLVASLMAQRLTSMDDLIAKMKCLLCADEQTIKTLNSNFLTLLLD